jgi:hypothetical protein
MTEPVKSGEVIRLIPILILVGIAGIAMVIMGYFMIDTSGGLSMKTIIGMTNIGIGTYILLIIINPFLEAGLRKLFGESE